MDQAIEMLKERKFPLPDARCMVIGNGEMGKLAAQSLKRTGADVTVTVRQYRSGVVTIPMGCSRINYGERLNFLPGCDLVVSATASPNYTLTKEQVEQLSLKKQIVFIDLAVPRDMEPGLSEIEGVELYTIDDFKLSGPSAATIQSMEQGRALIPRIQEIKEDAVTDLNLRLHKILGKLPLSEQERKDLEASIDTAAGKVVTKMIFGLRDTLETDAFIDCVEGLEKVYEE